MFRKNEKIHFSCEIDQKDEDTHAVIRAIGVSHTAYKDEFRQNFRRLCSVGFVDPG